MPEQDVITDIINEYEIERGKCIFYKNIFCLFYYLIFIQKSVDKHKWYYVIAKIMTFYTIFLPIFVGEDSGLKKV